MLAALTQEVQVENVKSLFLSHQDPDVGSSLPLWRRVCSPDMKVHLSWMWAGFVAHFDSDAELVSIPDEGQDFRLGDGVVLKFIPAHYMHSPGNYHVYDPLAKVLFTGDIGAANPYGAPDSLFVQDFQAHVPHMDGFHRRWLGSAEARDAWVETVSRLDIDFLAPQHGLIFKGDDVKRFIDWLSKLEVGSGLASMRKR
jgi:flavorubredoxin